MSEDQQIGFGGGDEDEMPPEMKAHMLKAFAHAAGLGPHPGMYKGPPRRPRDPDEITDTDRQRAEEEPLEDQMAHEASYRKMRAAATGGSLELGPTEAENKQVQQQAALQRQAATQTALKAQQAQAGQAPVAPPAAPSGPEGTETPYPAQARQESPPEAAEQGEPPAAPGQ